MKFNKSKKFFAGLMASLFVSGIGFNAKAIRTPDEINETIQLMFNVENAEALRAKYLPKVICALNSDGFLKALDLFVALSIQSKQNLPVCLMLALYSQSLRGNLEDINGSSLLQFALITEFAESNPLVAPIYKNAAMKLSNVLTQPPEEVKTYINTLRQDSPEKLKHLYLGCLLKISYRISGIDI